MIQLKNLHRFIMSFSMDESDQILNHFEKLASTPLDQKRNSCRLIREVFYQYAQALKLNVLIREHWKDKKGSPSHVQIGNYLQSINRLKCIERQRIYKRCRIFKEKHEEHLKIRVFDTARLEKDQTFCFRNIQSHYCEIIQYIILFVAQYQFDSKLMLASHQNNQLSLLQVFQNEIWFNKQYADWLYMMNGINYIMNEWISDEKCISKMFKPFERCPLIWLRWFKINQNYCQRLNWTYRNCPYTIWPTELFQKYIPVYDNLRIALESIIKGIQFIFHQQRKNAVWRDKMKKIMFREGKQTCLAKIKEYQNRRKAADIENHYAKIIIADHSKIIKQLSTLLEHMRCLIIKSKKVTPLRLKIEKP